MRSVREGVKRTRKGKEREREREEGKVWNDDVDDDVVVVDDEDDDDDDRWTIDEYDITSLIDESLMNIAALNIDTSRI